VRESEPKSERKSERSVAPWGRTGGAVPAASRGWRVGPGLLSLWTAIDARRPASWIALAAGGWSGWWLIAGASGIAAGMVMPLAAALAVAAIGDLPSDRLISRGADARGGWSLLWACERAAWPWAGLQIGMLVAGAASLAAACDAGAGTLLAPLIMEAARRRGAGAADAASIALLSAAAGAAVSSAAAAGAGGAGGGVPAVVWLLAGGLAWAWARIGTAATGADPIDGQRHGVELVQTDVLPANGPLRQWLTGLAMGASLVMMAGWLVLDRGGQAGGDGRPAWTTLVWGLSAAAWFIALAMPLATLQDGVAGAGAWDRLLRSAARRKPVRETAFGWLDRARPGSLRFAWGVAWSQANILAWPTLICAALSVTAPSAVVPTLGIAAGLAALAAIVMVGVAATDAARGSRETAFALGMSLTLLVATCLWGIFAPAARQGRPISPSPTALLLQRLRGG